MYHNKLQLQPIESRTMQKVDALNQRPVLDVDPFSHEALIDGITIDRSVREAGPAVWIPKYQFWAVGGHDQVSSIFRDWERFSSASGTGLTNNKKTSPWRKPSVILEVDPPQHTRTRSVLARILSPLAMKRLRENFQATADTLVDEALEQADGHFDGADLVTRFALQVMPDAVGLPEEGRGHLLPYANLNFNAMGPKNELYFSALQAAGDAPDWVARQCDRAMLKPEGFGAEIFKAYDAGELELEEARLLVRVFLTAALDTTIYGIGLGLQAFALYPEQWQHLLDDPSLGRSAFDEVLRFTAPSPYIGRTTTCPVDFHGVQIDAEEKVIMFLAAANRDPQRWERPDDFDVRRKATGHMAFGIGVHGCVGQMIARLEAEVMFNALIKRVRRFELTSAAVPRPTNWLRGFASLPLQALAR